MTRCLYENFLSSQELNRSEITLRPFVYVDPETSEVIMLAKMMESHSEDGEISALGFSATGMEFLSTAEE